MPHIKRIKEIKGVFFREQLEELENYNPLFSVLDMLVKRGKKYVSVTNRDHIGCWLGVKILEMTKDGSTGNMFCINRIETTEQGNGKGTAVMKDICEWADKNKVTLTLTPSTSFGASSTARLIGFYKRFGFILNKGRHSNFATRQAMYRIPK